MRSAVVALVGAALLLAGCAPSTGTARALVPDNGLGVGFTQGSYRFTVTADQGTYRGGVDPVGRRLDATLSVKDGGQTLTIQTRGIGPRYFARLTGTPRPDLEGNWYSVDMARVRDGAALGLDEDPTGIRPLVAAVTSGQRRSSGVYRGIVDLRKVPNWGPVTAGQIAQLGDAARTAHFEAAVDPEGRLTSMRVWVPGFQSLPPDVVTATYSDFGAAVPVALPSGVRPLPDSLYSLLNL
jgi:hypothetical protein